MMPDARANRGWWILVAASFLIAYAPLIVNLAKGPWATEQDGQGPLIIAASIWLIWREQRVLAAIPLKPYPALGWLVLITGLILMYVARTQGLVGAEMLSAIVTLAGCLVLLAGRQMLAAAAFPLAFLLFAVPLPDWVIDSATVPLKVFISTVVTWVLYAAGYPIAQNGVVIVIGPYQLLVKDACSGMNSILALAAVGAFYAYAFRRQTPFRAIVLLAATLPVAVLANVFRVMILVLIAYAGGIDSLNGPLHPLSGVGLFGVALLLLSLLDRLLGICFAGTARVGRPTAPS
jgi:exosortase